MDFKCTVWITLQNYLNNYNLEIQRPMYIDIKHFWKKQNKTLFKLSRGQAHDRVNAIAFILALGSWPSENLDDATCNLAFWLFFFTLQLLQLFWRMQGCFAVKFQKMFFFGWRKLQPTFHKCRGRVIFVQTCALMSISIYFSPSSPWPPQVRFICLLEVLLTSPLHSVCLVLIMYSASLPWASSCKVYRSSLGLCCFSWPYQKQFLTNYFFVPRPNKTSTTEVIYRIKSHQSCAGIIAYPL